MTPSDVGKEQQRSKRWLWWWLVIFLVPIPFALLPWYVWVSSFLLLLGAAVYSEPKRGRRT